MTPFQVNRGAPLKAEDWQSGTGGRQSSAARVRAYRERRRASGRRLVSFYLTGQEFAELQELARYFKRSAGVIVGGCIRDVRKRVLGNKSG